MAMFDAAAALGSDQSVSVSRCGSMRRVSASMRISSGETMRYLTGFNVRSGFMANSVATPSSIVSIDRYKDHG